MIPGLSAPTEIVVSLHAAVLDVADELLDDLRGTLSADERAQADARPDGRERRRFLAERGWRRVLLGAQVGVGARDVRYEVDTHGRPRIAGGKGPRFSASRSGSVALYAVSAAAPVGVDVEIVCEDLDAERLAGRVMSTRERADWNDLDPDRRTAALTACWTRKEAHGKARGTGLVFPLSAIEVWAADGRAMRHGGVHVESVDARGLAPSARPMPSVAAAVAVACPPRTRVRVGAVSLLTEPESSGSQT